MEFDSIEFVFTFIGIAFIFTRIPQIIKLVKQKSSNDISLTYWYLVSIFTLPWIWYAFYISKSVSLFLTYVSTTILNCIVIYLIHRYKNNTEAKKIHLRSLRKDGLAETVFDFLTINTIATIFEIKILYTVIGPNWIKLADACELLNRGYSLNSVKKKAMLEEI